MSSSYSYHQNTQYSNSDSCQHHSSGLFVTFPIIVIIIINNNNIKDSLNCVRLLQVQAFLRGMYSEKWEEMSDIEEEGGTEGTLNKTGAAGALVV